MQTSELIRTQRKAHGMTQVELAARAGCSQPFVSQIEAGSHWPRPDLLARIADALGCPEIRDARPVTALSVIVNVLTGGDDD